jgi:PiT family inorganic phosphate transporter
MAANTSGIQMSTVRNVAVIWVLTLPVAMLLAGCLYCMSRAYSVF